MTPVPGRVFHDPTSIVRQRVVEDSQVGASDEMLPLDGGL